MGRQTKTFRQTKRAGSADYSAKSYSQVNRTGSWGRIFNTFKPKKGEIK